MSFFERHSKSQGKSSPAKEWFEKGEEYFASQEYDKAIESYTSAISLDPNYLEAYFKRGQTYYIKQEITQALADLDKAISIDNKHTGSLLVRGLLYVGEKQYDKIVESFSQLLAVNPGNDLCEIDMLNGVLPIDRKTRWIRR